MEETRITFETAKLAKERQFGYNFNKKLPQYVPIFYCESDFDNNLDMETLDETECQGEDIVRGDFYFKSTQSLLQKWLREVHNIDVEPYLILMESNNRELEQDFDVKEYTYKLKHKGISQWVGNAGVKPSYDEAFEIGLQEGLKLIPIEL